MVPLQRFKVEKSTSLRFTTPKIAAISAQENSFWEEMLETR